MNLQNVRQCQTVFGEVSLSRRPIPDDLNLSAWDSSDQLLLESFAAEWAERGLSQPRALVIGDNFGGLCVPLLATGACEVTLWSDSLMSKLAVEDNIERNNLDRSRFKFVASTDRDFLDERFDIVLWKIPSRRSFLRYQIMCLGHVLPGAKVIAGGMDKYLPIGVPLDFQKLGEAKRRRGEKKAHLFDVELAPDWKPATFGPGTIYGKEFGLQLHTAPNVFGGAKFDTGSWLLLHALTTSEDNVVARRICDLGCGGGVLGIVAARMMFDRGIEEVEVCFVDESFLAVELAAGNAAKNSIPYADFLVNDGLEQYDGEPFDLIVLNPPFHQKGIVTTAVARSLIKQAHAHLRPGGQLWVVGNRHIRYDLIVNRFFRGVKVQASNYQFVVTSATKQEAGFDPALDLGVESELESELDAEFVALEGSCT